MPNHHYLPATYLSAFSDDTTSLPRRDQFIWVGTKGNNQIRKQKASNVGCINNFYTVEDRFTHKDENRNPEIIDKVWEKYETSLSEAIEKLIDRNLDARIWGRILVPFVACMLVRGPDFDERFVRRMENLGFTHPHDCFSKENINYARIIELQRLLGSIAAAKWIVLSIHGFADPLITNDLGYTPFIHKLSPDKGIAIPLDKFHILLIIPQTHKVILRADGEHWIPLIEYEQISAENAKEFNAAIANCAREFVISSNDKLVQKLLYYSHSVSATAESHNPGFLTGSWAMAHEFTWHRLIGVIEKKPSETVKTNFPIEYDIVSLGWYPPVILPLNLAEFPPALIREGNLIKIKFYDPAIYFSFNRLRITKNGEIIN